MASRRALGALLVLLLGAAAARAQQPAGEPVEIRPGGPQYGFRDGEEFVWVFLGGVEVLQAGRRIQGDTLVAVLAADGAAPAPPAPDASAPMLVGHDRLLELFFDGHVSVEEGDESISNASTYHLDNRTGVATVIEGELRSSVKGRAPLVVRYAMLRKLQDGTSEMEDLTYTTCTYDNAHWHIKTPWARIDPTPEGDILTTGENTVRVGGASVMWWPGYDVNLSDDDILLRRLRLGSSSRFGTEIRTEWGGNASEFATGLAGLFGHEGRVSAKWETEASWLSDRGFFFAPELKYHTEHTRGRLLGAFIDDQSSTDALDVPVTDSSRGRIDLEHRTRIDDRRTLDIEVSRESDFNFLKEYYENEYRNDKPQETYVSFRDVVDNHARTALVSTRLNDFQTQVEYQPQLEARQVGEPLPWGGFLTAREFISNARLLPDDSTGAPSARTLRVGASAEAAWPIDLQNGDRITVTAGGDLTGFDDTLADGSELRRAASGAVEWRRTYSGTSDARSETWNIDGLRRIVEPRVGYTNRFEVSHAPAELFAIDSVETLAETEAITVGLRDRIQTHQGGRVVTLLDTDIELPFFPHASRDNGDDNYGPLMLDTVWRPGANITGLSDATFRWRLDFDIEDQHYVESFASFSTMIAEGRRLFIGSAKTFHVQNYMTYGLEWLLNKRWSVALVFQEDELTNQTARSGIILRQLAHCWIIDYEISSRRGTSTAGSNEDEVRFTLHFQPITADPGAELADVLGGSIF